MPARRTLFRCAAALMVPAARDRRDPVRGHDPARLFPAPGRRATGASDGRSHRRLRRDGRGAVLRQRRRGLSARLQRVGVRRARPGRRPDRARTRDARGLGERHHAGARLHARPTRCGPLPGGADRLEPRRASRAAARRAPSIDSPRASPTAAPTTSTPRSLNACPARWPVRSRAGGRGRETRWPSSCSSSQTNQPRAGRCAAGSSSTRVDDPLAFVDALREFTLAGRAANITCPTWVCDAEGDDISASAPQLVDATDVREDLRSLHGRRGRRRPLRTGRPRSLPRALIRVARRPPAPRRHRRLTARPPDDAAESRRAVPLCSTATGGRARGADRSRVKAHAWIRSAGLVGAESLRWRRPGRPPAAGLVAIGSKAATRRADLRIRLSQTALDRPPNTNRWPRRSGRVRSVGVGAA